MKKTHNKATILRALMQTPELSDHQIARAIGVSQPTVSRIRQKLIANGMITHEVIPDIQKLGFEIFAITIFKDEAPDSNNIVYAANVLEGILVLSVHENYRNYYNFIKGQEIHSRFLIVEKPMKPLSFKEISFPVP